MQDDPKPEPGPEVTPLPTVGGYGTYGDDSPETRRRLLEAAGLDADAIEQERQLGEAIGPLTLPPIVEMNDAELRGYARMVIDLIGKGYPYTEKEIAELRSELQKRIDGDDDGPWVTVWNGGEQ